MKQRTLHLLVWMLLGLGVQGADWTFTATPLPAWDALFQRTNGWTGADGAFSIPLATNRTLWLFSDTWVGQVRDGRRADTRMVNNSIALQTGGQTPEFFFHTNRQGRAESFLKPTHGEGFYWLFHGARVPSGLYLFLHRVKTVNNTAFGFRNIGTSLGKVSNPDDLPPRWRVRQFTVPHGEASEREKVSWGTAVLEHEGWLYIYGTRWRQSPKFHGLVLARVPANAPERFRRWQFYTGGAWQKSWREMTAICPDAASEGAVFFEPALGSYVFLYSMGLTGSIVARTAPSPEGPWSERRELFRCPERLWSEKVFCYAGKAHPQLSARPGEWIVTYAANSHAFTEVIENARLYWPRFVRIQVAPAGSSSQPQQE